MSFYYWRSVFAPDSTETRALRENQVRTLYVRYFDVDWPEDDSVPHADASIRFDSSTSGYSIIPVIHFRKKVFEKMDSSALPAFTSMILALVRRIDDSAHLSPNETQFDCNWTEPARQKYFAFLRQYAVLSGSVISTTIRLQQLKFSDHSGIPPVDHGVLVLYNMDNADTPAANPVFLRSIAHRYTPSLRTYPLMLDLALPITPSVTTDDLLEMVNEVNQHSNHQIRDLIFFGLRRQNLSRYDRTVFKQILDHTD